MGVRDEIMMVTTKVDVKIDECENEDGLPRNRKGFDIFVEVVSCGLFKVHFDFNWGFL